MAILVIIVRYYNSKTSEIKDNLGTHRHINYK